MQKFEIGQKVRLNRCSDYHNISKTNPHHSVVGIVVDNNNGGAHKYRVKWPNVGTNGYRHKDLVKVD